MKLQFLWEEEASRTLLKRHLLLALLASLPTLVYGIFFADSTASTLLLLGISFFIFVFSIVNYAMEAKKKMEEVNDSKNQFIALSSHYLRTPLSIIKGFLSQMQKTPLTPEQSKNLTSMQSGIKELEILIDKFLTIRSIETGNVGNKMVLTDIVALLQSIVKSFEPVAAEKKVTLRFQLSTPTFPQVALERTHFGEAIVNLIDNAIKFNKEGGTVQVVLRQEGDMVVIEINDTGTGIAKEHLKTLFTTFNKGSLTNTLNMDKPGIGIGLYIAKLIIGVHKGKLDVRSEEGKGSAFEIRFPLVTTATNT